MENQVTKIRKSTDMNRKKLAEHIGIFYRTITDWELENRKTPEYLPRLLQYQVLYEGLIREKEPEIKSNTRKVEIIKDLRGNRIAVIDDIIFHNKQKIEWGEVEKYLQKYVGEFYTIADDKEKIFIGKDLPDEYARSKYTAKLKGAVAKGKANAAQAIPAIIEISENASYLENHEEKHAKDAKYGWYRYDSRFAIAIYNREEEIEKYNVFKVRMVIRHSEDGKKYLYDIINIKKESEYPA